MDGRINPPTTLGEQNAERVRDDGLADCLRTEHVLAPRERLEQKGCEVSIFSEEQQVLLVQRVDNILRVPFHDIGICQNRDPVSSVALGSLDPVHTETTGQTSNTTEHGFERLSHVV